MPGPSKRLGLVGCALMLLASVPGAGHAAVTAVPVASGFSRPVVAASPPGDTARLFVVEQHTGRIRIVRLADGSIEPADFLDLGGLATGNEQGLLGLAFHPDYASNGWFYVNLTVSSGDTEVRRYQVSGDPDVADPTSGTLVLGWSQPQTNHNGGWLGFGPDGYLYVSSGDGGSSDDAGTGHTSGTGNAQDVTNNLLGKMLRIDVDGDDFPADAARNYAIPPSNPFVGVAGDDEIWAYGLRNPWRASFDRQTGDLWMADVGQNTREEIDVQPAASTGGENYGWRLREGTIATPSGGVGGARPAGAIDPIYDYAHGGGALEGFSVTGGYVYRGPVAEIQGHYFFADYVTERIWSLVWDGSDPSGFDGTNHTSFVDRTAELASDGAAIGEISSFGEDALGNLYVIDLGGEIFRIVAGTPPSSTSSTTTTVTSSTFPGTTTTTSTLVPAVLLPGRKLVVKRTRRGTQRLRMVVKDSSVTGASPCEIDGELRIEAVGSATAPRSIALDAALWSPIDAAAPERGCRYRRGPIVSSVRTKTGRILKVVATDDDLGVRLATDPCPVRIEIAHGDVRSCVEFGGESRHVPDRKLVARDAPVATACPRRDP